MILESVLQARLVEHQGLTSSWSLELSMPLGQEEGDQLLSRFVPDCSETPPWECGREVNEEILD
jgi:hypothetical protein